MTTMRCYTLLLLLIFPALVWAQRGDDELVNIKELIPDIVLDIKYNTTDNFVTRFSGAPQKLYSTDECFVARITAERLILIQDSLRKIGLGLKMYDGYRPRAVQYLMWETLPPEYQAYVANPASGSNHNRGAAVDVSLVDLATGKELHVPTTFDWFGPEASLGAATDSVAAANRTLLHDLMTGLGGFTDYYEEWWHYQHPTAVSYPLLDFQLK